MSVVNTNIKALVAQQSGVKVGRDMATAMERLSTGQKINGAKDDAAGLAISTHMSSMVRGLNMSVKNANDAIALLQTAEGSMVEMTNMLQRMRELSVQSASDTNTSEDRQYLNAEFQSLKSEFNRIVKNTQWNGVNLLDGTFRGNNGVAGVTTEAAVATGVSGLMAFQVGANANQIVRHHFGDYHDADSTFQVGTITIQASPEALSGGVALSGTVVRFTVNDSVISVTINSNDMLNTSLASAIAVAIAADAELGNVLTAIEAAGVITLTSVVKGTAFTVTNSLDQDQSVLGYVETTANATRGWEVLQSLHINNQVNSTNSIMGLDAAIMSVNQGRADIGATISRLTSAIDNMTTTSTNLADSRSRILDTDYAVESTQLARSQIVSQAATAMLAQANAQQQSVLALLQ
jgi:flagellin